MYKLCRAVERTDQASLPGPGERGGSLLVFCLRYCVAELYDRAHGSAGRAHPRRHNRQYCAEKEKE